MSVFANLDIGGCDIEKYFLQLRKRVRLYSGMMIFYVFLGSVLTTWVKYFYKRNIGSVRNRANIISY